MVVGVAGGIVEWAKPTAGAKCVQECFVEPLSPKHRTVRELVCGDPYPHAADGAVQEQCRQKCDPDFLQPQNIGERTGRQEQAQVTTRLGKPLQVAAARELPQNAAVDGGPIPFNPQGLAYLGKRTVSATHHFSGLHLAPRFDRRCERKPLRIATVNARFSAQADLLHRCVVHRDHSSGICRRSANISVQLSGEYVSGRDRSHPQLALR